MMVSFEIIESEIEGKSVCKIDWKAGNENLHIQRGMNCEDVFVFADLFKIITDYQFGNKRKEVQKHILEIVDLLGLKVEAKK